MVILPLIAVCMMMLWLTNPAVFWSPDEGCKFIQMKGMTNLSGSEYALPYGARQDDPSLAYYPKGGIYPKPGVKKGQISFCWPRWFPLLSRWMFDVMGILGLYVLPAIAGIGAVLVAGLAAWKIVPVYAPVVMLIAGLASPMLFYCFLFCEYPIAVFLAMLAFVMVIRSFESQLRSSLLYLFLAAVILGMATALRFDILSFAGALGFTTFWMLASSSGHTRQLARPAASILLVLMAVVAVSALVYRLLPDGGAVAFLQFPSYRDLWLETKERLSSLAPWLDLPRYALWIFINNPAEFGINLPTPWVMLAVAGATLGIVSAFIKPSRISQILWIVSSALVLSVSLLALALPERYRAVHGLLISAPWIMLCLFRPGEADETSTTRFIGRLLCVYLIFHFSASLFVSRADGGPEWGSRFALVFYPMAAILAGSRWVEIMKHDDRITIMRTVNSVIAAMLVIVGIGFNARGVVEIVQTRNDFHRIEEQINRHSGTPVVTDIWWLSAAMAPSFVSRPFYTVDKNNDLSSWLKEIGSGNSRFLMITQALETLKPGNNIPCGLSTIEIWNVRGIFVFLLGVEPVRNELLSPNHGDGFNKIPGA